MKKLRQIVIMEPSMLGIDGHQWSLSNVIAEAARNNGISTHLYVNTSCKIEITKTTHPFDSINTLRCGTTLKYSVNDMGAIRWSVGQHNGFSEYPHGLSELAGYIKGLFRYPTRFKVGNERESLSTQLTKTYEELDLQKGDLVLWTTCNEFDLAVHTRAIKNLANSIDWGVAFYFHWGVFPSNNNSKICPPAARLSMLSRSLKNSWQDLCKRQSNAAIYGASDSVSAQISEAINSHVSKLTYPVKHHSPQGERHHLNGKNKETIKIGIPAFREEQGLNELPDLVRSLATDFLEEEVIFSIPCTEETARTISSTLGSALLQKVEFKKFPLIANEYSKWLNQLSIVILPYDREKYTVQSGRVSGIAVDGACDGKIMIVPSETSMSDLLMDRKELDSLAEQTSPAKVTSNQWVGISYSDQREIAKLIKKLMKDLPQLLNLAAARSDAISQHYSPEHFLLTLSKSTTDAKS